MIKYRYEKNIATVCVCVAMLSNVVVLLAFNQAVEMPFAHCGFYGDCTHASGEHSGLKRLLLYRGPVLAN